MIAACAHGMAGVSRATLIIAGNNATTSGFLCLDNSIAELLKQGARQHPILIRPIRSGPEIIARPREAVQFVEPHPMPRAIQSQTPAHSGRYFQRCAGIFGRTMRDGCDDSANLSVVAVRDCHHDCAGSILRPFDRTPLAFRAPEKAVADDEAGLRCRDTHLGSEPYSAASIAASVSSSSSPIFRTSRSLRLRRSKCSSSVAER